MQKASSLSKNTIANFVGLGYTTIIGIVILPLYLKYLGAEVFGLVGFFMVLQAWMQLLDMGMSPMLSRQVAQVRGQDTGFLELKKLLRSLELIIFIIALFIVFSIGAGSDWITNHWLNIASLPSSEVAFCIILMGVTIGLHFFSSLYRSGIQGIEKQVILNVANIMLVTLKFVGSLLLLIYITQDFVYFFTYLLLIGCIEIITLATMFYTFIPTTDKVGVGIYWDILKPMLPFAGGIAYTASIWVLLTQLDKLILSNVLPLSEYGYFALVVIVATGIIKLSGPISQAILPRMTYLLSQDKERDMLTLYRKSTQLMVVIILPLTGVIALYSTELLFAWTGDRKAAEWAGPILFWFSLGNGILAISAFQFYLQFAHGQLKMHVIYNTILASIQIPIIIYVAFEYGALGVAFTWFILRLFTFIIWPAIVHNKFAPGLHWPWLLKDILPATLVTFALLVLFRALNLPFGSSDRLATILYLLFIVVFIISVCVLFYSELRKLIAREIRSFSVL